MFFVTAQTSFAVNADTAQCRAFLINYYNKSNFANFDSNNFHYENALIVTLSTPYLNKALPDYTAFCTELVTGYDVTPLVKTVILYNAKKPELSYVMYASTYKKPDARFFKVFNNLQVSDTTERRLLSTDIASLMIPIHTDATIKELICNKYQFTCAFELWVGESSLRVINVRFTAQNKILAVNMVNGTSGGDVRNGYIRK